MALDADLWTTLEQIRGALRDATGVGEGVADQIDTLVALNKVPTPTDPAEYVIRPDNDDAELLPSCTVQLWESSKTEDHATPQRDEMVPVLVEVVYRNDDRGTAYEHCLVLARAVDMSLTSSAAISVDAQGMGVYHVRTVERGVRKANTTDRNRYVGWVRAIASVRTQRNE